MNGGPASATVTYLTLSQASGSNNSNNMWLVYNVASVSSYSQYWEEYSGPFVQCSFACQFDLHFHLCGSLSLSVPTDSFQVDAVLILSVVYSGCVLRVKRSQGWHGFTAWLTSLSLWYCSCYFTQSQPGVVHGRLCFCSCSNLFVFITGICLRLLSYNFHNRRAVALGSCNCIHWWQLPAMGHGAGFAVPERGCYCELSAIDGQPRVSYLRSVWERPSQVLGISEGDLLCTAWSRPGVGCSNTCYVRDVSSLSLHNLWRGPLVPTTHVRRLMQDLFCYMFVSVVCFYEQLTTLLVWSDHCNCSWLSYLSCSCALQFGYVA